MRKLIIIAALVLIVAVVWAALSGKEIGKYDSFQEALEKGIPYKVKDVIHTQNIDGVTVVLYTTKPDGEALPFANYDALAVAFFEGNGDDGWENIGPNGWDHYDNDHMTVYMKALRDRDRQGNVRHEVYVVYGEIHNADITTIEAKSKQEQSFEAVPIITNEGKRYYFQVGAEGIVRGLSKDGEVIDRQGG